MKGFPIADPRQIRVLASPIRQDIVDAVGAIGPCSVAELARALGRPADGLYYHIRLLLRAKLLVAEKDAGAAERRELRIDLPSKALYLDYNPSDPHNRKAVLRAVGSLIRAAERGFRRGFRPGVAVSGPRRDLWAGRTRGYLSADDVQEVNRLLGCLLDVMRRGRPNESRRTPAERKLYELSFVLAPAATGTAP